MIGMTVCSGIGAPEFCAPWIDWKYQSEIEPFPSAVLKARYPDAINLGDMTKFREWPDATIDVLCGGTPCQAFSVAGFRKGLSDPRGNLALVFLGIADRYKPKWIVWENVPGVLSSNGGRDFGAFLGAMAELGYGFCWRVLDAEYVRVEPYPRAIPQRRRRVFVVGYLGDWRRAGAVLLERESLQRHSPPRREAGKASPTIPSRSSAGGGLGTDFDCDGGLIASTGNVAHCLNADGMGRIDYETETMVAHALRGEGFDASEDGTGRGTPIVAVAPTLRSGGNHTGGDRPPGTDVDTCESLIPIAFDSKGTQVQTAEGYAPTLRSMGHDGSHQNGGGQLAVAFDMRGREGGAQFEGPHDTANIRAASGGGSRSYVAQSWAVRRLTVTECERLMGFPDGYTAITYRGKPSADGPRYKALGNSWAVNCGKWIFDRIRQVEGL